MKEKIMLLGGSAQQVIAIETAKRLGFYTVLCDFLPDNPGQYHADKFYLVSTTDKEAVLEAARAEGISGILAYASDPAAPTAAYVAEKMGLPGCPYESVEILCNKDKFREFLSANGFCSPRAGGYDSPEAALDAVRGGEFTFPVLVKPVDSSGSKGVSRIDGPSDAEEAIRGAFGFTRCGRVVVEEYVEKYGYQVAGDGLSIGGELVFRYFADDHFDPKCVNPFVPVSASFPCSLPKEAQDRIHDEIQRLLKLLGMTDCAYNFDIRVDADFNVYLMEVAPRDGGNYIPDVIRLSAGVDLVECSVLAAMGRKVSVDPRPSSERGYWAYFAVHSYTDGILKSIDIDPEVRSRCIVEDHILSRPGDEVRAFTGANTTLGILVMKFDSMEEMLTLMDEPSRWIEVELEEN